MAFWKPGTQAPIQLLQEVGFIVTVTVNVAVTVIMAER